MAQERIAYSAHDAGRLTVAPGWLAECKSMSFRMRLRGERPLGKGPGRWLGDFLDQDTPGGLLPAEEKLLLAAINGEPCQLQSRAARHWQSVTDWRAKVPEVRISLDSSFAAAMAEFLRGAPEAVQAAMAESTRHAHLQLGTPPEWEPQTSEETLKFASAQQAYLKKLAIEAGPTFAASVQTNEPFFSLCRQVVIEALSPRRYRPIKLKNDWFTPLLRKDPLNVYFETRQSIDAQPRVLRGFFGELGRHVRSAERLNPSFISRLKSDPDVLRPHFEQVLRRYLSESWRWVDPDDPETAVRADFVRFLCLGGDELVPAHERGLEVRGAFVKGDLDLAGCAVSRPLAFAQCNFEGQVLLGLATARSLNFEGSRVSLLDGEQLTVRGNMLLNNGFRSTGTNLRQASIQGRLLCDNAAFGGGDAPALDCTGADIAGGCALGGDFRVEGAIYFDGAQVGGALNCAGGGFRNRSEDGSAIALSCRNSTISGDVSLSDGFSSDGLVSFGASKIAGRLTCDGGSFDNRTLDGTGRALDFEDCTIERGASLSRGFSAGGEVNFCKAKIHGDLECYESAIDNLAPAAGESGAALALNLKGAQISGSLVLGKPGGFETPAGGSLDLRECHANEFKTSPSFWPQTGTREDGTVLRPFVYLDRFTFGLVSLGDNTFRPVKNWLSLQPPSDLGAGFKARPFDQLIKVYHAMGLARRARQITKFREKIRYFLRLLNLWRGWLEKPRIMRRMLGRNMVASALDWLDWGPAILQRGLTCALGSVLLAMEWVIVAFGTAYWQGWGRLTAFLLILWAGGAAFYLSAAEQNAFVPSNPAIALSRELQDTCSRDWAACKGSIQGLADFKPFTYSAEVMLPVLNTGQKRDWQPQERPDEPLRVRLPFLKWQPDDETLEIRGRDIQLPEGSLHAFMTLQMLLGLTAFSLLIATFIKRA